MTSSNPIAASACIGAGVGPKDIDEIWGSRKAYVTRVGAGPFPTEIEDERGEEICGSGAASTAPPPAARAAWAGLIWSPFDTRSAEHADRPRDHQARRPHRL